MVKKAIENSDAEESSKTYSIDSIEVGGDYAKAAIKFFDGYLSLCKNHAVLAVCCLYSIGTGEFGIKTKMECVITTIDGKHGDEAFDIVKRVWTQIRQELQRKWSNAIINVEENGIVIK